MYPDRIYTSGHSNRSAAEFVGLLSFHGVEELVDVRARPHSNCNPQFNIDALRRHLESAGIIYHWAGRQLGGMRRPRPDSPHAALDAGLRGYADYMETAPFRRAVEQLINLAARASVAVMCAEREPMHCHRSLIANFLTASEGVEVVHIVTAEEFRPHRLRPQVDRNQLEARRLVYDRNTQSRLDFDC